jgi:hypothetical protein
VTAWSALAKGEKSNALRGKAILYLYGAAENPRALENVMQTCNQYGIDVDYKRCGARGSCLVQDDPSVSIDNDINA